jgi:hypothetical protein
VMQQAVWLLGTAMAGSSSSSRNMSCGPLTSCRSSLHPNSALGGPGMCASTRPSLKALIYPASGVGSSSTHRKLSHGSQLGAPIL